MQFNSGTSHYSIFKQLKLFIISDLLNNFYSTICIFTQTFKLTLFLIFANINIKKIKILIQSCFFEFILCST